MIARSAGHVVRAHGDVLVAVLPGARVADRVRIESRTTFVSGDVVALERERVWIAPFGSIDGIGVGDRVVGGDEERLPCGSGLLGRAIDAAGSPLDGGPPLHLTTRRSSRSAPAPCERSAVDAPFWTGVRALDGLLPLGRGARVGIFGGPGSGKTSLLASIVAGARADAVVIALVGERGREAARALERLDRRTTVVCATSDRSATERVRAADLAMEHACALRDRGMHVLAIVDSLARYAAALRERRTAHGEAVGRGGYPPGVWFDLARFLERAGNGRSGSVTLIATVLSDGADEREPLSDAARSLLDGHVILSTERANAGRFPAIDVLASASRTMADCAGAEHRHAAATVRAALATLAETRDARELGLTGAKDIRVAVAVDAESAIEAFLCGADRSSPAATLAALLKLATRLEAAP